MTTFTFFKDKDDLKREGMLEILNNLPPIFPGLEEAKEAIRLQQHPGGILRRKMEEFLRLLSEDAERYRRIDKQMEAMNLEIIGYRQIIKDSDLQGLKDALAEQTRRAEIAEQAADELRAALALECSLHEEDIKSRDQSIAEHQQTLVNQQSRIDAALGLNDCL